MRAKPWAWRCLPRCFRTRLCRCSAVDARVLAVMESSPDLAPDMPEGKNQHDLMKLQIACMALIKERTRLLNRSKHSPWPCANASPRPGLSRSSANSLNWKRGFLISRQCPKRARAFDIRCSIPGPGRINAAAILVECPQIASLAPMTRQSGRRHRRSDRVWMAPAGQGFFG